MIHEWGNVPSSNQKDVLRDCTKWKVFIGRRGRGLLARGRKDDFFRPGHHLLREGKGKGRGLYHADCHPFFLWGWGGGV